jgi:hypothetical protein
MEKRTSALAVAVVSLGIAASALADGRHTELTRRRLRRSGDYVDSGGPGTGGRAFAWLIRTRRGRHYGAVKRRPVPAIAPGHSDHVRKGVVGFACMVQAAHEAARTESEGDKRCGEKYAPHFASMGGGGVGGTGPRSD